MRAPQGIELSVAPEATPSIQALALNLLAWRIDGTRHHPYGPGPLVLAICPAGLRRGKINALKRPASSPQIKGTCGLAVGPK